MDEQKILVNFGLNCKLNRIKLKMSQDDIVNKTDFSKSYVSNVEGAKHNISLINATKLAEIFHKTLDEMVKDV